MDDLTLREISFEYLPAILQLEYEPEDLRKIQMSGNAISVIRNDNVNDIWHFTSRQMWELHRSFKIGV